MDEQIEQTKEENNEQKPLAEILKEIKEESQLENAEDISFPRQENYHSIKLNIMELAGYYVKFYNEFVRYFSMQENKEIKEIINKNKIMFQNILILSQYKENIVIGKYSAEEKLKEYVIENYNEISSFFDLFLEVFEL